jgi:hypothetical protein
VRERERERVKRETLHDVKTKSFARELDSHYTCRERERDRLREIEKKRERERKIDGGPSIFSLPVCSSFSARSFLDLMARVKHNWIRQLNTDGYDDGDIGERAEEGISRNLELE